MRQVLRWCLAVSLLQASLAFQAERVLAGPETAGTPVSPQPGTESEISTVLKSDGAGGAFVAFKHPQSDRFTRNAAIGVVRLTPEAAPDPTWTPLALSGMYSGQDELPRLFAAGGGQVWLAADRQDLQHASYVVRGSASGLIPPAIQTLNPGAPDVWTPSHVVEAGAGAVWFLSPALSLRLAADGSTQEFPAAISVPTFGALSGPAPGVAAADGNGGAYVIPWSTNNVGSDATTQGMDLVLYRVDGQGGTPWSNPSYRVISTAARDQVAPAMIADAALGATVVWEDRRTVANARDIYVTRLAPDGSTPAGWLAGGRAVAAAAADQWQPTICPDGAGGVWVAWSDQRTTPSRVFVQHLLQNGSVAPGFPTGGRALAAGTGAQTDARLVPDGSGGCFAIWLDSRNGNVDVYGLRLNAAGAVGAGWGATGEALCTHPSAQAEPVLVATSSGHAIAAWRDARNGGAEQVFALALSATGGTLDVPRPGAAALRLAVLANPSRGRIALQFSAPAGSPVDVELLDVNGRVVRSGREIAGAGASTMYFEPLEPGLYFASAVLGGTRTVRRVAVVR